MILRFIEWKYVTLVNRVSHGSTYLVSAKVVLVCSHLPFLLNLNKTESNNTFGLMLL